MTLSDTTFLEALADSEIEKIRLMKAPVVRVCGPLTCDGVEGYARNAERLEKAEHILQLQGNTVWKFGDSERFIQGRNFSHDDIITHFHERVLRSGLIRAAYFLPRWQASSGARRERELCKEVGSIALIEFLEDWFL